MVNRQSLTTTSLPRSAARVEIVMVDQGEHRMRPRIVAAVASVMTVAGDRANGLGRADVIVMKARSRRFSRARRAYSEFRPASVVIARVIGPRFAGEPPALGAPSGAQQSAPPRRGSEAG
jgi:hypothetical protein